MFDDQGGCEWVNLFILLAAYPGCPGQGAVKPVCVCVCVILNSCSYFVSDNS